MILRPSLVTLNLFQDIILQLTLVILNLLVHRSFNEDGFQGMILRPSLVTLNPILVTLNPTLVTLNPTLVILNPTLVILNLFQDLRVLFQDLRVLFSSSLDILAKPSNLIYNNFKIYKQKHIDIYHHPETGNLEATNNNKCRCVFILFIENLNPQNQLLDYHKLRSKH